MIADLGTRADRPSCPKQYGNWLEELTSPLQCPVVFCVYNNAFIGLECTEHQFFDIIITDKNLRHLNGLEMLGVLKAANASTPVILMVRESDESISEKLARELGFSALITDALHSTDLCSAISHALCSPVDYCESAPQACVQTLPKPPTAPPSDALSAAAAMVHSSGGKRGREGQERANKSNANRSSKGKRPNPSSAAKDYFSTMFPVICPHPLSPQAPHLVRHPKSAQSRQSAGRSRTEGGLAPHSPAYNLALNQVQVQAPNQTQQATRIDGILSLPQFPESMTPITAFLENPDNFTGTGSTHCLPPSPRGAGSTGGDDVNSGIDRLCTASACSLDGEGVYPDGRDSSISQCMLMCATPTEYYTHLEEQQVGTDADANRGTALGQGSRSLDATMGQ